MNESTFNNLLNNVKPDITDPEYLIFSSEYENFSFLVYARLDNSYAVEFDFFGENDLSHEPTQFQINHLQEMINKHIPEIEKENENDSENLYDKYGVSPENFY